jgi:hypothetical protein
MLLIILLQPSHEKNITHTVIEFTILVKLVSGFHISFSINQKLITKS